MLVLKFSGKQNPVLPIPTLVIKELTFLGKVD